MNCSLCYRIEPHSEDATEYICGYCTQILLAQTQEKIRGAYQVAIERGLLAKARMLSTFLEEEETYVTGETDKPKRNLVREGPMRMVKPSLNKVGAQ